MWQIGGMYDHHQQCSIETSDRLCSRNHTSKLLRAQHCSLYHNTTLDRLVALSDLMIEMKNIAGAMTVTGLISLFVSGMGFVQERSNNNKLQTIISREDLQLEAADRKKQNWGLYCSIHLCFWMVLTS